MGGAGYTIDVKETQSAGEYMTSVGDCAQNADGCIQDVTPLPAPEAGQGVGAQLKAFTAAWHGILPDLKTEMDAMSAKAKSTATVYYTVEEQARGGFARFAE